MARRVELTASLAVMCLGFAVMSGHLLSIDGLAMWRQALALAYHHSWSFVPPIWWGSAMTSSYRGIGASLQYLPTAVVFQWLSGHVPLQAGQQYDFRLYYSDQLYAVAGAPVWVVIMAVTAYLVGLTTRLLGGDTRSVLWAMTLYGLGSPALAAARGDWPQPLVAICWALGAYASLKYGANRRARWLVVVALAVFYAVLARPLEGSLLLPAVLLILWGAGTRSPSILAWPIAGWAASVVATLLLNWARFGSPTNFGYPPSISWTNPIWIGFPSALLSPGRGVLWEFPALVLSAVGAVYLWRRGNRWEVAALAGVPFALFVEACQWFDWVGGWDWGFRLFVPALPFMATLAGLGVLTLGVRTARWLPSVLLAGGVLWNLPVVTTDILAGYGASYTTTASNWKLDAYPPIGAWRFLKEIFPSAGAGGSPVDIVWFRATRAVGTRALLPFGALVLASAFLWWRAWRGVGKPEQAC